jgi:hypothetical protein
MRCAKIGSNREDPRAIDAHSLPPSMLNCMEIDHCFYEVEAWRRVKNFIARIAAPCGALYEKTDSSVAALEKNRVVCVVCSGILYESQDPLVPTFKLIMRPESDTQ